MNNRMKRLALVALLLLLAAIPARAGEEMVPFKSGTENASALLVTPAGKGPFPAVLVIQEWWGLNDWVKDQARALAREGCLGRAPGLYRGQVAAKQEGAEDKGPSPDQVRAFEAAMKKAGKSIDVKIYEGAGHAFANVDNPWGGYRAAAAKDAWARTTAFLAKHLKK